MTVDDPIAAAAPLFLEHVNTEHGDWALLVGRVFGGLTEVSSAAAVALDRAGIDLAVVAGGSTHAVRVAFPEAAVDGLQLQGYGVALAREARRIVGQLEPTSLERQAAELAAIRTFVTRVVRAEMVTPRVRQLTFGGGDLATFEPLGPDQYLYVLAPPPGRDELTIDASFTWEQFAAMPPDEQPIGAYYTVRRWRPQVREIDMLFVLHEGGAAAAWAAEAGPGDPVALWGPRSAFAPPTGTDWFLLVADDTGLPAVAAIIESLRPGTPVEVVVEVDSEADRLPLPSRTGVTVTWRYRRGAAPGTTTALVDAVRAMTLPAGTPYAWGGAESKAITAVRRHVRDERGLPPDAVSMTGYWRR